jgi:hypothetical protein
MENINVIINKMLCEFLTFLLDRYIKHFFLTGYLFDFMRKRKRVLIGPIYSCNTVSKRKQQRFLLIRNPLLGVHFERFLH